MAFPVVAATSQGNDTANTTNHTVNLPAGIVSGNLIVIAIAMDGNTSLTWPAGWTVRSTATNSGGDGTLEVRSRIADGTEGASITITTAASEAASYICWRITGHDSATAPEAGTPATGSDAAPNAPSLTASWGSADNLFIWVAGWGLSSTALTAYPSNYTISQMQDAANNSNIGGIAIAGRELAAATDDPAAGTLAGISTWVSNVLVVKPAGAAATKIQRLPLLGVG